MTRKRRNPLRGPIFTLALMLGSAGAVIAIDKAVDAHTKGARPTVAAATAGASSGQASAPHAAGAMLGG